MIFKETPLPGAYTIELEKRGDERGFFARFFCVNEYEKLGLDNKIVQVNNSTSKYKGTLRGIHYQAAPKGETKIVRCIKGSFYDVIVEYEERLTDILKMVRALSLMKKTGQCFMYQRDSGIHSLR